ncbi:MAG: MOSC N-terminal beta barrel domain-containing protein [Pseudomonadota bacterium]
MSATLAHIFRHPIKGIGSETLEAATVSPAGALHGDRAWALLSGAAPDIDDWQPRRNFLQVASGPSLAAIRATTEGDTVRLSHPERAELHLAPKEGAAPLIAWLDGLWPADRPGPGRLVLAPGHGMTDMAEPYISVGNLSSLRALSERAGCPLDMRRFRINLWLEGLAPWEEFDLLNETLRIGALDFMVAERIGRCRAPEADPETGLRNVNTNRVLEDGWGHSDFGVYVRAQSTGDVHIGDPVSLPWS